MGQKQVFVVTNTASINTKATRDLLTAGELGIYAMNGATLKNERAVTGNAALYEFFVIALGRGGSLMPFNSFHIDAKTKTKNFDFFKAAYQAPVLPQVQVATDCAGASNYDDFMLRVSVRFGGDTSGMEMNARTYTATGKFETEEALYAKIAQLINEDRDADVTATSSAAGVVVSPKLVGSIINVGFEYVDNQFQPNCTTCLTCDSTITILNEGSNGEGTSAQLMDFINNAKGYMGTIHTDSREVPLPIDQYNVVGGSTWDFYWLKSANYNQAEGASGEVFNVWQEILVAAPAGTNMAAYTQVVEAITGKTMRTAII